jgi:hypothetical protein
MRGTDTLCGVVFQGGRGADEGPAGRSSWTWKPRRKPLLWEIQARFGSHVQKMADDERGLRWAEPSETLVPDTWHGLVQKP